MSWEECVTSIQNTYKPAQAVDAGTINWAQVDQNALDTDSFKDGKPFLLICPDRHCVESVNQTPADHAFCNCKDMNGQPIADCTPKTALTPEKASVCINIKTRETNGKTSRACTRQGDDWYQLTCYCCCSCFANGTLIAVPSPVGFKKIEDIQVAKDKVCTAKLIIGEDNIKLAWGSAKVSFSQGTGPDSHQSNMISIIFDNPEIKGGAYKTIIVTPDHLFLISTGKLKRADQLVPGKDFLVNKEGNPISIHEISSGEYNGGVHHIATAKKFTGHLDDHLILAEGIVTGDFELQINSSKLKDYMTEEHNKAPKIGTDAYVTNHGHLKKVKYAKFQVPDFDNKKIKELKAHFYTHGEHSTYIPATAARYLSVEQERDVDTKLDLIHFTELAPKTQIIKYLIRLYKGFFPDINIYFDSGRLEANAYGFINQYGEKIIIISGGLARIANLNLEGLAMIIAHMISCVQKSAPVNNQGYTSVGMADYYSTMILQTVFFIPALNDVLDKGISQLKESLFDNISDKDKTYKGDPYKPSIDTRLDAIDAGIAMSFPPPEIGGPEYHGLELLNAICKSPIFNEKSFITDDIDTESSTKTFNLLVNHKVLTVQGVISSKFTINTELGFLFDEKDAAEKALFTEEVRYILLHQAHEVTISFNMKMRADRISSLDDFEFNPDAVVKGAILDNKDSKRVHLSVAGLKHDTKYTLTCSNQLLSQNGSTVNPDKNSVTFKTEK
ncbi:MAG: Hint domain-containing protein [Methylobacter sp.]